MPASPIMASWLATPVTLPPDTGKTSLQLSNPSPWTTHIIMGVPA